MMMALIEGLFHEERCRIIVESKDPRRGVAA
jgi:hypothetical protein